MSYEKEIAQLWREIKELRAGLAQRPLRVAPGGSVTLRRIVVIGGQTLATGQDGIKYSVDEITEVPDAYDPDVDTAFIDGIGVGNMYLNGILSGKVLIVLDNRQTLINFDLLGGDAYLADRFEPLDPVTIPVDGGGYISAYPPDFI